MLLLHIEDHRLDAVPDQVAYLAEVPEQHSQEGWGGCPSRMVERRRLTLTQKAHKGFDQGTLGIGPQFKELFTLRFCFGRLSVKSEPIPFFRRILMRKIDDVVKVLYVYLS